MSYILDALKKAEAERNVGAVPTMHAQPLIMPATAPRPPLWRQPWLWAALAAALLMLALLAWLTPWKPVIPAGAGRPAPEAAATPAAPPPVESAAVPAPSPVPPLANAPVEAAPPSGGAAAPEPAPAHPPKPASETAREAVAAKPARAVAEPKAKPEPALQSKPQPKQEAKEEVKPQSVPARETQPAEPRIVALSELPPDIRAQVPTLKTNGYIYSVNKADRTVLINQKLLREGDQVAPDLVLESLTPTGMVLNFRGHRYRASY